MLCLHIDISRLQKPRCFTLYAEEAQQDPRLKAKLQEALQSRVYAGRCASWLENPISEGQGELGGPVRGRLVHECTSKCRHHAHSGLPSATGAPSWGDPEVR